MKHYMLVAALIAAGSAQANEAKETCGEMSELAETIGELRYNGAPMRELMEALDSSFAETMVQDIYALPDYSSEEYQQQAIRSYTNNMYAECYEELKDK